MDLDFGTIIFYALAVIAAVPAAMVMIARDIVRVAFWLLASLSAVAGLYILLDADFLGLTQVLVYIGGILVLILFGIMMTHRDPIVVRLAVKKRRSVVTGFVISASVFATLLIVITGTGWETGQGQKGQETLDLLGTALLTDYVLPFEIISVLLVVVLCGAAYIARRREEVPNA